MYVLSTYLSVVGICIIDIPDCTYSWCMLLLTYLSVVGVYIIDIA